MPPKKPVKKTSPKRTVRKTTPRIEDIPATDRIPLMLYRRIAVTFTVLVAAVLLIVVYLSTMQAIIRVRPMQTTLKTEFIAEAVSVPVNETDVAGQVRSGTLGKTQTFKASGEGAIEIDDFAEGTVTLHNNQSSAQPLVVRTRLLSREGIQVRLTEGVTVPAKGTIDAHVRADEKGASGDLSATRFTIPGLSEAKQALIYADNVEPLDGGVKSLSVVTQKEIDGVAETLRASLAEDAKSMLRAEAGNHFSGEAFFEEVTEQLVSIEPNTEAEAFDVTLGVKVTGVFLDKNAIERIAERKLYDQLGQGHELVSIDKENSVIIVDKYNSEERTASLRVELTGQSITSRTSKALDVDRFLGMTSEQVEQALIVDGVATEVNVDFFPFWVRKIPRLRDHVYIKINE